jgi:hypothetical protein
VEEVQHIHYLNCDLFNFGESNDYDHANHMNQVNRREIDLLENQAIRNPIFRRILDRDKRLIYDRKTAQANMKNVQS